jgi:hypothetical protein
MDNRGNVCALGAIELSTTHRIAHCASLDGAHYFWGARIEGERADSLMYRRDNAVLFFSEHVPMGLCPGCRSHEQVCGCGCDSPDIYGKVAHYNDLHCVGSDVLTGLLRTTADRAATAASVRRTLLTGDRLPVLV